MYTQALVWILILVTLFPQQLFARNPFFGPEPKSSFSIPWVEKTPPVLSCRDKMPDLADLVQGTGVIVSAETADLVEFSPSAINPVLFSTAPSEINLSARSHRAEYGLVWDEYYLYGVIQVHEPIVDKEYPTFSKQTYFKSSEGGFFPDLLYDSVVLVISDAAGISERFSTEMHLFFRPPGARQPKWTFFGRTGSQGDFHELYGSVFACLVSGGYYFSFAVRWLPSPNWQPKAGSHVRLNMLVPLPYSANKSMKQRSEGTFALQRTIDITLKK
jgi:hypothetical protein